MATSPHGEAPTVVAVVGTPGGWGWTLASGIVLLLAGIFSLLAPLATVAAFAIFLGWVLLIAGIAGIVMGIRTRSRHARSIDLLYGIVSFVIGMIMLIHPLAGAVGITYVLALWLGLRGVVEIVAALRKSGGHLRSLLLLTGVLNVVLAILLLAFPLMGAQLFGLFVAVSFLFGGFVTVVAALQLRRLAHP
jgi:uncharacterized membrane protein HdeD (DUF308 family)